MISTEKLHTYEAPGGIYIKPFRSKAKANTNAAILRGVLFFANGLIEYIAH
jgi:hypothetical protein